MLYAQTSNSGRYAQTSVCLPLLSEDMGCVFELLGLPGVGATSCILALACPIDHICELLTGAFQQGSQLGQALPVLESIPACNCKESPHFCCFTPERLKL